MKKTFTFFGILLMSMQLYAYESLMIYDVRDSWWGYEGSIENTYVSVTAKGQYAECDLIVDFTAEGTWFSPEDSLEVQMTFKLPAGAEVIDLWLWISGEPIQANIYDRWTAGLIYEDIVKRRIDPAILVKENANEYNLKIFPILFNLPRSIKIKYLVPINQTGANVYSVPLPVNISKLSYLEPNEMGVYFQSDEFYNSPILVELPQQNFSEIDHPEGGKANGILINNPDTVSSLTLAFSHINENILGGTYTNTALDEKFFQLKINPGEIFEVGNHKKAVFLIDFIDNNCNALSSEDLLMGMKNMLLQHFSESDSFNILFSGTSTVFASTHWIGGGETNINSAFNSLTSDLFKNYTNLPNLVGDGISFLKNRNESCPLVLLASSNGHGDSQQANDLINDIQEQIGNEGIPIHIINLDDQYYDYYEMHYIGGQYYLGNEYLYIHLSLQTSGEYYSIRNADLNTLLSNAIPKLSGYFKSLDVYIGSTDGFTFSNFSSKPVSGLQYYDEPMFVTGKYLGNLPFELQVFGQLQTGEIVNTEVQITENQLIELDSVAKTIWEALNIKSMLQLEQDNLVISEILNASIENRVLCTYTSFLVLEPGYVPDLDGDEDTDGEWEWPLITENSETNSNGYNLLNYPNPFSINTTISYSLNQPAEVSIKVIDIQGREIAVLNQGYKFEGNYSFTFDAESLEAGIYYYILIIESKEVARNKMLITK